MTFNEFIAACPVPDNPQGDFINDARADIRMPLINSAAQLESHIRLAGGCFEAVEAGKLVWRAYASLMDLDAGEPAV